MSKSKLLFICNVNRVRSATAERLYENDERFECLSAGIHPSADTVISSELLHWADIVLVMELKHIRNIKQLFPKIYSGKEMICLDIPDNYYCMQPELINLLRLKMDRLFF